MSGYTDEQKATNAAYERGCRDGRIDAIQTILDDLSYDEQQEIIDYLIERYPPR